MRKLALAALVAALGVLSFATMAVADIPDEIGTPKQTGIAPGEWEVKGMYFGARAEAPVWIYNAKDSAAEFEVSYKHPDYVQWDYDFPPVEAQQWVTLGDATPGTVKVMTVPAHKWASVLVVLELPEKKPEGTTIPKRWEFRITVMERSTDMVIEKYEQRWLIEMVPPGFSLTVVIIAIGGALALGAVAGAYLMTRRKIIHRQG